MTTKQPQTTTPDQVFDQPSTVQSVPASPQPRNQPSKAGWVGLIIGVLAVGLLSGFVAGMQVGKSSLANTSNFGPGSQNSDVGGMRGARGTGAMGTVTAVSSDSITVEDQMRGATQSFKITSDTTVTDNGASASVSDIKTGDTVMVRTNTSSSSSSSSSSTDTQTASSIILNPTMGGGPTGDATQSQSSNDGSST